jgi:hypothetical protein
MAPLQNPRAPIHEDLDRLLDQRGLLRKVAEETGTDYKRIHELVSKRCEPGHLRGGALESWIQCASMLAATNEDLARGKKVPFMRWLRLQDLKEKLPRALAVKIDCALELLGPSMELAYPSPAEAKEAILKEEGRCTEAKQWIRSSIADLLAEIEERVLTRDALRRVAEKSLYAGFWEKTAKSSKEMDVVQTLWASLDAEAGPIGWRRLRKSKKDPPDCEAESDSGLVGFEVSELVHGETRRVRAAAQAQLRKRRQAGSSPSRVPSAPWKEWSQEDFLAAVAAIVREKDRKQFGSAYMRRILVIHTAEPLLSVEDCATWINGRSFGPAKQLTDTFLLFSYQPGQEFYPYLKLTMSSS